MYRVLPYAIFYMVIMSLQIFVIDKLTLSVALAPLIYVGFVALLPLQYSQLRMVLLGFAVGVVADLTMGMAGVNTIATTFIAYIRYYILMGVVGRDSLVGGGAPSMNKMGVSRFLRYLLILILLHHAIMFATESLGVVSWGFALRRLILSSSVSLLFISILSLLFAPVLGSRSN